MAGYDGTGFFTLNYSFVQDAASGINILASRQDTQWTTIAGALNNVICRDGQSVWTGNQNAGNHKITNLATPSAVTDAARLGDIPNNVSQWYPLSGWSFNTTTSVIAAGDQTSFFEIGRRAKVYHNNGATETAGTVTNINFAGGNTVVTMVMDAGVALLATVTGFSVSIIQVVKRGVPDVSAVGVYGSGSAITSNSQFSLGVAPFAQSAVVGDIFGEWSSGTFLAHYAGLYKLTAVLTILRNGATITGAGNLQAYVNGSGVQSVFPLVDVTILPNNFVTPYTGLFNLAGGDLLSLRGTISFTGGPPSGSQWEMNITRSR